jgi:hypothetical protein
MVGRSHLSQSSIGTCRTRACHARPKNLPSRKQIFTKLIVFWWGC